MASVHKEAEDKDHAGTRRSPGGTKKQSLLGGTIAEKFGGSSKDILEEE